MLLFHCLFLRWEEMRMRSLDSGCGFCFACANNSMDIEDVGGIFRHLNTDRCPLHIGFGIRHGSLVCIAQHLQPIRTMPCRCPQRNSNRESRHAGVGNTHRHSVLVDILT